MLVSQLMIERALVEMHPSLPDLIGRESLWEGDVDSEAASESGGNVLNRLDSMGLRSGDHESRRRELDGKGGRGIVYWLKLLDLLYRKETHFFSPVWSRM